MIFLKNTINQNFFKIIHCWRIDGDNKKNDTDWKNGALCFLDLLRPNHSTGTDLNFNNIYFLVY